MNQLVMPFDVTVSKQYLKDMHKGLRDVSKVLDFLFDHDEINIFNYLVFGLGYSAALAEKSRYQDYHTFIKQYNNTVDEQFGPAIQFIKEVYSQLALYQGAIRIMTQPKFKIEDRTNIFKENKFKHESHLEQMLVESLKNWTFDWNVQRQKHIGNGKCDISITTQKEKLAIELKKDNAQRKDVYQALEYTTNGSGYEAALVARSFDSNTIKLADQFRVRCYEYQLATILGEDVPFAIYLEAINDPRPKTEIELLIEDINSCEGHIIEFSGILPSEDVSQYTSKLFSCFKSDLYELIGFLQENQKKQVMCPNCNTHLNI